MHNTSRIIGIHTSGNSEKNINYGYFIGEIFKYINFDNLKKESLDPSKQLNNKDDLETKQFLDNGLNAKPKISVRRRKKNSVQSEKDLDFPKLRIEARTDNYIIGKFIFLVKI